VAYWLGATALIGIVNGVDGHGGAQIAAGQRPQQGNTQSSNFAVIIPSIDNLRDRLVLHNWRVRFKA
jgi:hypothetical protein